jgi:formylglycine-generating enzyme required for sulfatase activity
LHNVHGNVWEWCQDPFGGYGTGTARPGDGLHVFDGPETDGASRVFRGGSYHESAAASRSASRTASAVTDQKPSVGVRPARALR